MFVAANAGRGGSFGEVYSPTGRICVKSATLVYDRESGRRRFVIGSQPR